jgi:hypothetical protein
MLQACLRFVPVGDIGLRTRQARRGSIRVADGDAAAQHPAVCTGSRLNTMLVFEMRRFNRQMRTQGRAQALDVIRVDPVQPVEQSGADFVLSEAQHRLPSRREVHAVADDVPVPQTVIRAGGGKRVALLALFQESERFAQLAFRLLREFQCLLRLNMQLGHFFRVALFSLDTAKIDLIAAECQVDGRNQDRKQPLVGAIDDGGGNRSDCRPDEIVRGGPQEVIVPHPQQRLRGRQCDRDGNRRRVGQVVCGR